MQYSNCIVERVRIERLHHDLPWIDIESQCSRSEYDGDPEQCFHGGDVSLT